jgi:cytochrome c oxidase subunit I
VLGFLVWGHHMFVSGQSMYAGMVFSFLSFLVAIPSAVKVFNWTATLYKGSISSLETPMLYALGFIGLFTIGGLTGLFLATMAVDVHVHDTYFVVAHFHYIMVGGAVMAYLGGIHFWWPKMTGRMYPSSGALSAGHLRRLQPDVLPAVRPGLPGDAAALPRVPEEFQVLNVMSSAGASILASAI